MYALLALLVAGLGVLPYLFCKRFTGAVIQVSISFLLFWGLFYIAVPSLVYPFGGLIGGSVFLLWIIASIAVTLAYDDHYGIWLFPIIGFVVYIISFIVGSGIFNASQYAAMLNAEKRVWTQDVQPKNEKHMRMVATANAVYKATMAISQAGAIGSQFQLSVDHTTLQVINKELWFVIPLDYNGFSVWWSVGQCPGYVMIHGEDPHRKPIVKILDEGKGFKYMPGAYFGDNLERYLRNNGYLKKGLTDETLEIDESGKAWWVVTAYKPTIIWSGEKTLGVVIIDPVTGDLQFHESGKIPAWVDRCDPKWLVQKYADWWGKYSGGWINSWWGKKGLLEPETPNLIYSEDGQPEWVTGITSRTSADASVVGLVYTNSRTGKSVYYEVAGGATDTAILDAVAKNSRVKYLSLHGTTPQLYNVYGTMASVVPLLNEQNAYQGCAIVNINDVQRIAVGSDQYEALREYQKLISHMGQQVVLDKERKLEKVSGIIERRSAEPSATGQNYYIKLAGIPKVFFGGSELSPAKLPVIKEGDRVQIEFYASDQDLVPMKTFDNLSIVLKGSPAQKEVQERALAGKEGERKTEESRTIREGLKRLSDDQQKELYEELQKKNKK